MTGPLLTLLLFVIPVASAAEEGAPAVSARDEAYRKAEAKRLSDELEKLVRRQAWAGAARTYAELEALGLPLGVDELYAGALTARQLGEMGLVYERLLAAAKLDGRREIVDWLWAIDTGYGRVTVIGDPSAPPTLTADAPPLLPEQRACIETAQRHLAESARFEGLLPAGTYRVNGAPIEVTPGAEPIVLDLAPEPTGRRRR
ncbi:hypothetical protein L6R49_23795 [Myxococcota bacterium]|nr:hypothetical protein [Myxococcota bacterium]